MVVLTVAGTLFSAAPASAHSKLISSSPQAGAILDTSPPRIELELSEAVGVQFSTITLYNRERQEQPLGPLAAVPGNANKMSADVTGTLPGGTYTVVWRAISAVDGHLTAGTFAFRVCAAAGAGTAQTTPEPEGTPEPLQGVGDTTTPIEGSSEDPGPLRWLVRGIELAAAALLTGGALFIVLILEPTIAERGEAGAAAWPVLGRRFARIGLVAALVLPVALVLDLAADVADVAPSSYLGAFARSDVAIQLLTTTRYGFAWTMKLIAALLLLGLFAWIWRSTSRKSTSRGGSGLWEVCIAAGSFLLLAEALSSHGAAVEADQLLGLPLPVVSDWLHLVTAAAWVGGLAYMALVLFPTFRALGFSSVERRAFLARSIPRFSGLAVVSVVVLAVSGIYNLAVQSTDLSAILGSTYGQVLVIKHVLLFTLLGLGAVNLLRLSPMLRGRGRRAADANSTVQGVTESEAAVVRPVRSLGRNIRVELGLAGFVLLCAAGLTLLPPPSSSRNTYAASEDMSSHEAIPTPYVQPPPTETPAVAGPAIANSQVGGYRFTLLALPSIEGDELTLTMTKALADSPPLTDVNKVIFKITPQDVDGGSTSYTAEQLGGDDAEISTWHVKDSIFTLDGTYVLTMLVQRTEAQDERAAFRMQLATDGTLTASAAQAYDLRLETNPSPPISGTASITVTLLDGAGSPISDARISVNPLMPSHAHKEPTDIAKPVAGSPGKYTMPVNFSMGGGWLFIFDVDRAGMAPVKLDASLDVIDPSETPTPAAGSP